MSNFLSKGKRQVKVKKDKTRKKIFKKFNFEMKLMEYIYGVFKTNKTILTKENIDIELDKITDYKISDKMKELLLEEFKENADEE